eukprot:GHVR01188151.1.p1 GENE.GHVR01188151.1~~GHVR01188151.1.p1  ORF type:complete len:245 (+),score=51.95 GHVR01188151.1:36-737(+)
MTGSNIVGGPLTQLGGMNNRPPHYYNWRHGQTAGVESGQDQHSRDFSKMHCFRLPPLPKPSECHTFMPLRTGIDGVTGYSGWVPALQPENLIGESYTRTKKVAASIIDGRAAARRGELIEDHAVTTTGEPFRRLVSNIAGYTGCIPQKYVRNAFGSSIRKENMAARAFVQSSQDIGWHTDDRSGVSLKYRDHAVQVDRVVTPPPAQGIPGYTGYYPRYVQEQMWLLNTFGSTD